MFSRRPELCFKRRENILDRYLAHALVDFGAPLIGGNRARTSQHVERTAIRAVAMRVGGAEDGDARPLSFAACAKLTVAWISPGSPEVCVQAPSILPKTSTLEGGPFTTRAIPRSRSRRLARSV